MAIETNQAQVLYGPQDLRLIERPLSTPEKGEVQITIKSTTLCGTDLHYFKHYANGFLKVKEPLTQGHEASGVVVSIGDGVTSLQVGDRVAIEAGVPCESCANCLAGRYNVCPTIKFRSSAASFPHFQGTLQNRVNHPARWCHKLPDELSFDEGALLEPLSVAMSSVQKANIGPESRCFVIGAGAVGLLCAAVAKHQGCKQIVMADIAPNRLNFALEHGFADKTFVTASKRGDGISEELSIAQEVAKIALDLGDEAVIRQNGFDAVFECTGVEACVRSAIYSARPAGQVILVGMGTPIQTLPVADAAFREVDIKGVWRYANTYPAAIEMMKQSSSQGPHLNKLITHTFKGLESVPQAFSTAGQSVDGEGNLVVKVVVQN